jgi:hypothetical protein
MSHARTAREFMVSGMAAAGPTLLTPVTICRELGLAEGIRLLRIVTKTSARRIRSLATETFWSRTPYLVGPLDVAVKFILRPAAPAEPGPTPPGDHYLRDEFVARLRDRDVVFQLSIQRFVDEARTPIEDGSVGWDEERVSGAEPIATLVIPRRDLTTPDAEAESRFPKPRRGASR